MTQSELAEKVGVSRVYISQIESGQRLNLSDAVRRRLMEVLGLMDLPPGEGNLPPGLADFALSSSLPDADVRALASIELRGMRPETPEEWRMVYHLLLTYLQNR